MRTSRPSPADTPACEGPADRPAFEAPADSPADSSAVDGSPALVALLDRVGRHHGDRAVRGLVPGLDDRPGWRPAGDLRDPDVLDAVLATTRRRWAAPAHVSAGQGWKCYSFWSAAPLVYSYAVDRRVPLLDLASMWLRPNEHRPFIQVGWRAHRLAVRADDPLAGTGGVLVVDSDHALADVLRERLLDRHLDPLVEALRTRVALSRRVLLGSVAAGVAHALSHVDALVPRRGLVRRGRLLLARLGLDPLVSFGPGPTPTGLRVQRRTCCLKFRLPGAQVCQGCPIQRHPDLGLADAA